MQRVIGAPRNPKGSADFQARTKNRKPHKKTRKPHKKTTEYHVQKRTKINTNMQTTRTPFVMPPRRTPPNRWPPTHPRSLPPLPVSHRDTTTNSPTATSHLPTSLLENTKTLLCRECKCQQFRSNLQRLHSSACFFFCSCAERNEMKLCPTLNVRCASCLRAKQHNGSPLLPHAPAGVGPICDDAPLHL